MHFFIIMVIRRRSGGQGSRPRPKPPSRLRGVAKVNIIISPADADLYYPFHHNTTDFSDFLKTILAEVGCNKTALPPYNLRVYYTSTVNH